VNVASRIEALTKELGAKVLTTDTVWEAAGRDDVAPRAKGSIKIRGREKEVTLVELA
jgi:class 3 adenylate cyclase